MYDTIKLGRTGVRMVAHRGVSGLEKENTASAFVAAGNRSYFGVETDVHLTLDGQFIIIHDDTTARVALDDMTVEKCTFDTLRKIQLCDRDDRKGRNDLVLPSLQEYIQICKKYEKYCVLELKNPFPTEDIDRMITLIDQEGWLDHTIFISFHLENVVHIRKVLPAQLAQFLISSFPDWLLPTLKEHHLDLDIYFGALTQENLNLCHENGIQVNVWTVDKLEDAQRLADWGVDYITSNIVE